MTVCESKRVREGGGERGGGDREALESQTLVHPCAIKLGASLSLLQSGIVLLQDMLGTRTHTDTLDMTSCCNKVIRLVFSKGYLNTNKNLKV